MASDEGRILVVDDNPVNRRLLVRALEAQGYAVQSAEDGRQALELLRAGKPEAFDIVLLDILMPVMDGYQTLAEIKRDSDLTHLPVIMISALDEIDSVIRCVEMGATDYLPKPYNAALLRARIGTSLERKRLRDKEKLYLRGLERELEIGREIQSSFLPAALPQPPGWEIAVHFQAARQVAGDFYDAFPLDAEGGIGLVVADVCDKGVGAALFMALIRTLVRALAIGGVSFDGHRPAPWPASGRLADGEARLDRAALVKNAVLRTNHYITQTHAAANMFATLLLAALDPSTGELTYVNAGQEPALVIGSGGVKARLAATGMAVGILPEADFRVERLALEPGDVLLGFTDGVPDALSPTGERFGRERMLSLLAPQPNSARELLDRIQKALLAHMGDAAPFDDVTMLAVRYGGELVVG
jgi:serine phosphatase RsbU (regulator of sigma subunit)